MSGTVPAIVIITANGSNHVGGWDVDGALEAARQIESGSGQKVVRMMRGHDVILEGYDLRRALDDI